jgi:hypothetical protein
MALLKNILLTSSILVLTACAARWDNADYSRIVDIRHTVAVAQREKVCEKAAQAQTVADALERDAHWLMLYSDYLPNNEPNQQMATALYNTAAEFSKRYQGTPPSKVYCELKLKTMAQQIETIQRTNAGRPR